MKELIPTHINYISEVMSEFDCRVLTMMKFRRRVKKLQEVTNDLDDFKEIDEFILSKRFAFDL
ncbi:MAG: hypothetical protein WC877_01550 [Dehalococcoidales bacterium]|jgi:hypothetical protein